MTTQAPLFELRADATLSRVKQTYQQRGSEYQDTWRFARWIVAQSVLRKLGYEIKREHMTAIAAAILVDVKHERMMGPYKEDSLIDGIAYTALLVDEMKQFE